MKTFLKGLAVAAFMALAAMPARAETTEINFGFVSSESQQALKDKYTPFINEMEKQTGLKINPFFAADYAGVIEGMKFNKVQVAAYGNKSAMEAVDRSEGQVFAHTVNKDGTEGYYGLLLTNRENAALNNVDDIKKCDKSLSFGNGDPNSTSGFLVPSTFIFSAMNIDVKTCYKAVTNANHESNAMAVANKQVDFATNNTENMSVLEKKDPEAFSKIKIIWKSPLIPADPFVWRKDLDANTKGKIMNFFMSYGRQGTVEDSGIGDVPDREKNAVEGQIPRGAVDCRAERNPFENLAGLGFAAKISDLGIPSERDFRVREHSFLHDFRGTKRFAAVHYRHF